MALADLEVEAWRASHLDGPVKLRHPYIAIIIGLQQVCPGSVQAGSILQHMRLRLHHTSW